MGPALLLVGVRRSSPANEQRRMSVVLPSQWATCCEGPQRP